MAKLKFVQEDLRKTMADIAGQEIMTADKVTPRMNVVVTYRVADSRQAVSTVENAQQALYREAQLAVRAVVGARELNTFLIDRDGVAREMEELLRKRVGEFGLEIGNGGHAEPGQHGQAAGGRPDLDATARVGSARKDCLGRQAQRRAGREGPGRPCGQPAVSVL